MYLLDLTYLSIESLLYEAFRVDFINDRVCILLFRGGKQVYGAVVGDFFQELIKVRSFVDIHFLIIALLQRIIQIKINYTLTLMKFLS